MHLNEERLRAAVRVDGPVRVWSDRLGQAVRRVWNHELTLTSVLEGLVQQY